LLAAQRKSYEERIRLIIVLVNDDAASRAITDVLLDGGLVPAAERREVIEGRRLIPVGPPERKAAPGTPVTEDADPSVLVGVDATELVTKDLLGRVGKIVHEITVGIVVAHPVLRTLDIEPHETVLDVGSKVVKRLNLSSGVAALRAGEHVDVDVLKTGLPGVGDALRAVVIRVTSAAEATNDGKSVAAVAKALP